MPHLLYMLEVFSILDTYHRNIIRQAEMREIFYKERESLRRVD